MAMIGNKQVLFKDYVKGFPKEENMILTESAIGSKVPEGSTAILVKNLYISCDPYMRLMMSDPKEGGGHPFLGSFIPGQVFCGFGVSKVVDSSHPDFKVGDFISGTIGWEEYTLIESLEKVRKIKHTDFPLSHHVGVLSFTGLTAYAGFYELCFPKKGETIFVSTAAGAVGQLVGQFAKLMGCYVVGSAGSQEKVNLLKSKFGYDDAFNYKEEDDFVSALKRHCPKGIDMYFENVGGRMLDAVLEIMNPHGRIAVCGMISQYNLIESEGVHNMYYVVQKRIKMQGFFAADYIHLYPKFTELVVQYLREGKLVYVEDIMEGIDKASSALVRIFSGHNIGKQIVRIAQE